MKSNFWQRTLTGAFFVAFILGAVWFGMYSFWLLLLLIVAGGLLEYAAAFTATPYAPARWPLLLAGVAVFACLSGYFFGLLPVQWLFLCMPLVFLLFVYELYHKTEAPFQRAAMAAGGVVYIAVSISLFAALSMFTGKYSPALVMSVFLLIWSSDTFAYLSGRTFGKHPLFPRVSPKKTWEGSIGGLICTMGISLLLYYIYGIMAPWQWMLLAAFIMIFGTWGDLVESMLKRSMGLKDSGSILPGHGGMLDRFDSLLFSLPFLTALLYFFSL